LDNYCGVLFSWWEIFAACTSAVFLGIWDCLPPKQASSPRGWDKPPQKTVFSILMTVAFFIISGSLLVLIGVEAFSGIKQMISFFRLYAIPLFFLYWKMPLLGLSISFKAPIQQPWNS